MQIDWLHFQPWTALAGGMLIGLASVGLMAGIGQIAGISGILAGVLGPWRRSPHEGPWRWAFLLGLMAAPWAWQLARPLPPAQVMATPATLIAGGLLVGLGTRYAGGCTSGHGVCGLSRLSMRSLIATLSFMAAGFATVAIVRHLLHT